MARKLFTRLGKFSVLNYKSTDYGIFSRYFYKRKNLYEPDDIHELENLLDMHESNNTNFHDCLDQNVCNSTQIPESLQDLEKQLEQQGKVADSLLDHYEGCAQKPPRRRYRIHPKLKSPNSKRPKDLEASYNQDDGPTSFPYKRKTKSMFPKEIGHGDCLVDTDLDDYLDPVCSSSGEDVNQKWLTPSESSFPASKSISDESQADHEETDSERNRSYCDLWAQMNIKPLWKQSLSDSYLYKRAISIKETTSDLNHHGGQVIQASQSEPLLVHNMEQFSTPWNSKSSLNVAFYEPESVSSCPVESESTISIVLGYDTMKMTVENVDNKTTHTITTRRLSSIGNVCISKIDVNSKEDQKNWPPTTYLLKALQPPKAHDTPFELSRLLTSSKLNAGQSIFFPKCTLP